MKRTTSLLVVLPLIALAYLLGPALGPRVAAARQDPSRPVLLEGSTCIVQLRRDALGLAARTIVAQSDDVFGESRVSIRGVYRGMNSGWFVISSLQDDKSFVWIPREVILSVETTMGK